MGLKKENKKAVAWTEKITYIECPDCENVEDFESGMIPPDSWTCEKCNKLFEIDDCTD